MKILQVDKLTKLFGELSAVNNLSFEVERGETFGIAGPNGAGKTTLFNLIGGYYHGSGDIIFNNENISRLRPHQICHKGIVRTFQVPALFPTLSILENVKVGAHFGVQGAQDEKENVEELINFVGLQGKENSPAAHLNTLAQKQTMLAAALATKPKLLLLDEPMAGLSPEAVKQSIKLFQKINSELGITFIIIEHRMRVLVQLCRRLMLLHNGKKICIGPIEEVCKGKEAAEVYLGVAHA